MTTRTVLPIILALLSLGTGISQDAPEQNKPANLTILQHPRSFYLHGTPLTQKPEILLRFNARVSLENAQEHLSLTNSSGEKLPLKIWRPKNKDTDALQYEDRSPASHFLMIKPISPLTLETNWYLKVSSGLSSVNHTHELSTAWQSKLGKIYNFKINSIRKQNSYDGDKSIFISFSKPLHPSFTAELLRESITVSPEPKNLEFTTSRQGTHLRGDFEFGPPYTVRVRKGIIAIDETSTTETKSEPLRFQANPGFITLPAYTTAQSAAGKKEFDILTGNLTSVKVRVKDLKGDNLIYALRGYDAAYQGNRDQQEIPFEMVPGSTFYQTEIKTTAEIDHTEKLTLDWEEILPAGRSTAAFYLCTEGRSKTKHLSVGGQALIQLTDIGLAWKQTDKSSLIYAFSHRTGAPLVGGEITLYNQDATPLTHSKTGENGVATVLHDEKIRAEDSPLFLEVKNGDDRHVIRFSEHLDQIGLWNFSIPYQYRYHRQQPEELDRRMLMFTDRGVYKPGEKVYLKAITRLSNGDSILSPDTDKATATLRVNDAKGRKFHEETVSISQYGSFDTDFDLPRGSNGFYSIELDFNTEETKSNRPWMRKFHHRFQVADYRVNTFELSLDKETITEGTVTIPVAANYYMGKPLSKAQVTWHAQSHIAFPKSHDLSGFQFGKRDHKILELNEHAKFQLRENGTGTIAFSLPENEVPTRVVVNSEITDINQQTIAATTSFVSHSSDFYLGLRKPEGVIRAGENFDISATAIDTEGARWPSQITASLTLEKEHYTTVKVKGTNGRIVTRNEQSWDFLRQEEVEIDTSIHPGTGLTIPEQIPLSISEPGNYRATLTSRDQNSRLVETSTRLHIFGADEATWSWGDTIRIDIGSDRKEYKIGDTAKLLVRSPIFGHALITTERAGVRETFTQKITQHETEIEIPIVTGDAPNIFASVLIIRGSKYSPHQHPETDYRIGYCQLKVNDPATRLDLSIETPESDYTRPGEAVTIAATVRNQDGAPVPNTEVTLYAVDEGVLSLTSYRTPTPGKIFHAPFPLRIGTGQSISSLFPEAPQDRSFTNKGYVIGGGGMADSTDPLRVRENFAALAHWSGSLITGPEGKVTTSFTSPDSLTTYRIMAIANHGLAFGSAEKDLIINKPLIIQPALPAFSNVGDVLELSAILHNNTARELNLDVDLELDEHAKIVNDNNITRVIPASLDSSESIRLQPGETNKLTFPVEFTRSGTAIWKWSVQDRDDAQLADVTESKLNVGYPVPLLRETFTKRIDSAEDATNLLSEVTPQLLNGIGEVRVSIANSRILEAMDSLDYLLRYPYGCVEQTTSTTLPWLSTQNLRKALPNLQKSDAEIVDAIKAGTDRLLSMQTHDGGLSYWPGHTEPMLRGSAWGGLALALAQRQGIDLPSERLDAIWSYISKELRNSAKITNRTDLSNRCLALYTLALAGKPEPAYHGVLYEKREQLPSHARALLALAIMETNESSDRIATLLKPHIETNNEDDPWYSKNYSNSARLLAWSQYDSTSPVTEQLVDEVFSKSRLTTYSSAWKLLGLAKYHKETSSNTTPTTATLSFQNNKQTIDFKNALNSHQINFPFEGDLRETRMDLSMDKTSRLFAHVEVATQPVLNDFRPVSKGFTINRTYQGVEADGTIYPADQLTVGDLVLITLDIDTPPGKNHYLAIDDPLPSIFEAINPNFSTQAKTNTEKEATLRKRLYTSFTELREDRALFFCDYLYRGGEYRVQYLARVVAPGSATAPPAKVEAMYSPEKYGLSATKRVSAHALDLNKGKVALK